MNGKSMTRGGAVAVALLGILLAIGGCTAARQQRATIEPTWSYVRAETSVDQARIWPVRDSLTEPQALRLRVRAPAQP